MTWLITGLRIAAVMALLCAPAARAANTTIQDGESNATIRGKLNQLFGTVHNVRMPPYNAIGDDYPGGGHHDDTAAIQGAIDDACVNWGGTVYIPSGVYLVTSTLNFNACSNDTGMKARINMQGDGPRESYINCSLVGFCVDQSPSKANTPGGYDGGLWTLDGLSISNNLVNYTTGVANGDIAGGALHFEGSTPGQSINNCALNGGVGLVMAGVTFGGSVSNCGGNGPGVPGSVGIYAGQISVSNVRFLGWDVAFQPMGATTMTAISTESSNIGVLIGLSLPNVFRAFIDNGAGNGTYTGVAGSVMTVTKYAYGSFLWDDGSGAGGHGRGIDSSATYGRYLNGIICFVCAPNTYITSQISAVGQPGGFNGAEGRYQLNQSMAPVPEQTMATNNEGGQPAAASINGWQTERLNWGLYVNGAASLSVQNAIITGTIGLGIGVMSASYTGANGGTITYNLTRPSGRNGAATCFVESFTPNSYNFSQDSSPATPNGVNCQWANTSVAIRGVDNPGAPLNGVVLNPNSAPTSLGSVSPRQDGCMYISYVDSSTFRNIDCGTSAAYDLDLSNFNPQSGGGRIGFYENHFNGGIKIPTQNVRAAIEVRNNRGFGEIDLQVRYQDLPGVPGASPVTVKEGEEHLIIDANLCSDGNACATWGANVTGGGGPHHVKVRWNGANWTIVGK